MNYKTCTKCGEEKPATPKYFHKQKTGKHGVKAICKSCAAQYEAQYRAVPEVKERLIQYRAAPEFKEKQAQRDSLRCKRLTDAQPGCIYEIVNSVNNKVYIGETTRGVIRYEDHIRKLCRGAHKNPRLQADFNKYGEEVFEWRILEVLPKDKELLEIREKEVIGDLLHEGRELYNKQHTDQTRTLPEDK